MGGGLLLAALPVIILVVAMRPVAVETVVVAILPHTLLGSVRDR
jgi:hypothetical protein